MEKYFLGKNESFTLYKMMWDVKSILEKNNIPYWVCGGTLLGVVRCKGIIKWDDDLDIGIPKEYEEKVEKVFTNNMIFQYYKGRLVNKIYFRHKDTNGQNYSYPFIDVFYYEKKNGRVSLADNIPKSKWPMDYWHEKDFFPLREYEFGAYKVTGPFRAEDYFKRSYGDNWNKTGKIWYDHKNEKTIKPVEWRLRESDYEPAMPFYKPENWWEI